MKAVVCSSYGPPARLRIADVPRPEARAGEIVVEVHAATVTRTDTATLRGHPFFARAMTGLLRPRHTVPGLEFAGRVIEAGPGVSTFAEGARVFGMSPEHFGAQAQYMSVRADGPVATIPDERPFHQAVLCEGAWYARSTVDRLAPGQHILIYGASGAIGTAAVMLAKAKGAQVTAAVQTRHLEMDRSLGADRVIDCETSDIGTLGERFDIVFDAVGKTSYFACRELIAEGGQYCATDLGPYWSNIWLGALRKLPDGPRVSVPFPVDPAGVVQALAELMRQGRIRPVIDRHFALDEIVAAYDYVETGRKRGIVVIDVFPPERAGSV